MIDLNPAEEKLLLISAFRYALGRQTYITGVVTEVILRNWDILPIGAKELFVREILEHNKVWPFAEIDKKIWFQILEKYQSENQ